MNNTSRWLGLLMVVLVSGCAANPPFSAEKLMMVDRSLTPQHVSQNNIAPKTAVLWGGVIVDSRNMNDYTELTVLGYPLDSSQRPETAKTSIGRFLVRRPEYLEPLIYSPKREITVVGMVDEVTEGRVGDSPYHYPVVKADRIYLWPLRSAGASRFSIGVGVGVGVGIIR
ncbi:MAG: Slp family lipoprotein [Gammaproteobacteria bacterium]